MTADGIHIPPPHERPQPVTPPDLVIFDCDGVLVDTEAPANQLLAELLTEAGWPTTAEQSRERFTGTSMNLIQQRAEAEIGRSLGPGWADWVRERTIERFGANLDAIDGIEAVLDRLDAVGQRYCVASSGSHEKMHHTLGVTGLLPRLRDRLNSAVDVGRGKPFPDLFLYAARRHGADPARCIVIEDSPPGVQAAHAAGMPVFAYLGDPHGHHDTVLALQPQRHFNDMRELPGLLGW